MRYSVISTGGKQYLAVPGQKLVIESVPGEPGNVCTFDQVLLQVDGEAVKVGLPLIAGAKVEATIVEQSLADKIRVFKYKSKSRYRRTTGHRQHQTVILISDSSEAKKQTKSSKKAETVEE
jgi:large subunit ribosomal protein L21